MARLMPTAFAMSSICASRTPRLSKRPRVAAMMSFSRAPRRAAAAVRRPSVSGAVVMTTVYECATGSCTRVTALGRRTPPAQQVGDRPERLHREAEHPQGLAAPHLARRSPSQVAERDRRQDHLDGAAGDD